MSNGTRLAGKGRVGFATFDAILTVKRILDPPVVARGYNRRVGGGKWIG